jgi:hypothetical protein
MAEKLGKDFVPQAQHEAQLAVMNELMATTKQESDNMAERNFSVMRFMEVPPDFQVDRRICTEFHKRVITEAIVNQKFCHACASPVWSADDSHLGGGTKPPWK